MSKSADDPPRDPYDRSVALIAHGVGSTPEFVTRVLGGPLADLGYRVASWRWPASGDLSPDLTAALAARVERVAPALVGGVSLGAHAAAAWAAATGWTGLLLLVMPAWTGLPDDVAALSAAAADELAERGLEPTLTRITTAAHPWVADELARAWPSHGTERLVAALRMAAGAPAPSVDELRHIRAAAAVVALAGDSLHPDAVARQWAQRIPHAALAVASLPADGRAPDLGGAAATALRRVGAGRLPGVSASLRSPVPARADRDHRATPAPRPGRPR